MESCKILGGSYRACQNPLKMWGKWEKLIVIGSGLRSYKVSCMGMDVVILIFGGGFVGCLRLDAVMNIFW